MRTAFKFLLVIFALLNNSAMPNQKHTMLCLGDSYTIGEAVNESERFPNQAVALLHTSGIEFDKPLIIGKTGWTTDELSAAIRAQNLNGKFDLVTLLIGVNNQYRGRDLDNYRKEFDELLQTAINHSLNGASHVLVISIPDWGATPFALNDSRDATQIGKEIDAFNQVNREEAGRLKANYIDITAHSRLAKDDPATWVAGDGLHPSAKMYHHWAEQLAATIERLLR
jgi:lysophospholipase L1-like esterase